MKVENGSDDFNPIEREMDNWLVGVRRGSEQRADLFFLESKDKRMEFYQSSALESIENARLQGKETFTSVVLFSYRTRNRFDLWRSSRSH